jgi:multidrug efflux pump
MRFSHFFISRPIFAAVLSIFITLAGAISLQRLPVAQYPEVVPPTVVVRAFFPGANPQTIAETVATPIEQEVNGVENMLYMTSQSTADGAMTLTVTFKLGTNIDAAQVLVQNRVASAEPRLPEEVRRIGVTTRKSSPDLMMVVALTSPDRRYDALHLSNYAYLQVLDAMRRVPGVGDARIFGAGEYAMRLWLDPEKLASLGLSAADVVQAVREQNVQVASGFVGQSPAAVDFQLPINVRGRLGTPEEFGRIIVRTSAEGAVVRVRDVARVELGQRDYSLQSRQTAEPSASMPIFLLPGANALDTARAVRAEMAKLARSFPDGITYRIDYDTTQFVEESVNAVVVTFFEAVVLVVLVVMLFLQSWRSALIPLVAVPVSIVGTFAVLAAMGYTLNNLTLFGLVLAIGIVVDDAIVVVENVERNMALGLPPVAATRKAMDEVSGPVVSIALVLCAVFLPTVFIPGISGEFYKQFAITIAVSTVISAFNSLTLSPALCAVLLKPHGAKADWLTWLVNKLFGPLFRVFNRGFDAAAHGYARLVRGVVRFSLVALVIYVGLLALTWAGFRAVPPGFIPQQDKGYLVVFVQLPDGASLDRTRQVMAKCEEMALTLPGVTATYSFPGFHPLVGSNVPNVGALFVTLQPFAERKGDASRSADTILGKLYALYADVPEAFVGVFPAPAIQGLGSTGGFKLYVQDRAGAGYAALGGAVERMAGGASQSPLVAAAFSTFRGSAPQVRVEVDREKAKNMGLSLADIYATLQTYLGSTYINDFNAFGRTFQVQAQADTLFRTEAVDIGRLKLRTERGDMVPIAAVATISETFGPDKITHYNMFPAVDLTGVTFPGVSTGQAIELAQGLADRELMPGLAMEWTELTLQEILAGNVIVFIFPLCVLLVFLTLAAQYESWSLPLAIILIVPMCLLAAIGGVWFRGMDNNIFTQIGFIVLVGLACKNAILIVEFAKQLQDEKGLAPIDAAVEACRLRLRPILMTSFAFILGVVPLLIASGAGAEMRQALGTAVFYGMLGVTVFGLVFTPVFYVVIMRFAARRAPAPEIAGPKSGAH